MAAQDFGLFYLVPPNRFNLIMSDVWAALLESSFCRLPRPLGFPRPSGGSQLDARILLVQAEAGP
jgi:hypothetical protein